MLKMTVTVFPIETPPTVDGIYPVIVRHKKVKSIKLLEFSRDLGFHWIDDWGVIEYWINDFIIPENLR